MHIIACLVLPALLLAAASRGETAPYLYPQTDAFRQNLARARLAPIAAVGRDRERLWPHHLAPDAPGEAEAVTAHAPKAGLIVIRRAEPGARNGDDAGGIGGGSRASRCDALPPVVSCGNNVSHSTDPSWPPSLVA